jgi:hypothetical protein
VVVTPISIASGTEAIAARSALSTSVSGFSESSFVQKLTSSTAAPSRV